MRTASEILGELLKARGIDKSEEDEYLSSSPKRTHDPFEMLGMREAADLIIKTASGGGKVCIYGDYDTDGVTSVTLMTIVLREIMDERNIRHYIPSRFEEGYGLNMGAVKKIRDEGADLLITVDCGCTSVKEVEYAKELGLEVIITDHHNVTGEKPPCTMLDPKQPGCGYPFKGLCGCGVAFKLAQALQRETGFDRKIYNDCLDIVGIATIGDIVPLADENRTIAKLGLRKLRTSTRAGLRALFEAAGIDQKKVNSERVSYAVVPRINACGRMEDAELAVELLLSDEKNAAEKAEYINSLNYKRRSKQEKAYEVCLELAEKQCPGSDFPVIRADEIHEGIAGIAAGKVSEELNRPAIIVTPSDGLLKGTGRSIGGLDIYRLLKSKEDIFIKFGGHAAACGFTMREEDLGDLRRVLHEGVHDIIEKDPSIISWGAHYDICLEPGEVSQELVRMIEKMEPFGEGNPKPKFCIRNVKVERAYHIGNGTHVKMITSLAGGGTLECVAFSMADKLEGILNPGEYIDIVGSLEINEWNGRSRLQMNIDEAKKA